MPRVIACQLWAKFPFSAQPIYNVKPLEGDDIDTFTSIQVPSLLVSIEQRIVTRVATYQVYLTEKNPKEMRFYIVVNQYKVNDK